MSHAGAFLTLIISIIQQSNSSNGLVAFVEDLPVPEWLETIEMPIVGRLNCTEGMIAEIIFYR